MTKAAESHIDLSRYDSVMMDVSDDGCGNVTVNAVRNYIVFPNDHERSVYETDPDDAEYTCRRLEHSASGDDVTARAFADALDIDPSVFWQAYNAAMKNM